MVKIYVPDIECESCTRLISKKFNDNKILNYEFDGQAVILQDETKKDHALKIIKSLGYRADTNPFERKTLTERWRSIKENTSAYSTELTGLTYAGSALIILFGIFTALYFTVFDSIQDFMPNYGVWIFYLILSIVAIGTALWHFLSYRARVTCMTGMMIGMMFGMQAGMMIGAVLGATNGFFIGATVGMLLGVFIGIMTGKCCGVMGVMQGMMAGVMGGTMGPMISVMMLFDHINLFMPIYMALNLVITFGLIYLFYEEVVEKGNDVKRHKIGFVAFASACTLAAVLLSLLIIYGPKSYVVGG